MDLAANTQAQGWGGRGGFGGDSDPNSAGRGRGGGRGGRGGLGQLAGLLGSLGVGGINPDQERDQMGFPQHRFGVELSLDQKKEFIRNGYLVVKDAIPKVFEIHSSILTLKELVNRALRAINHQLSIPPDQYKVKIPGSISIHCIGLNFQ